MVFEFKCSKKRFRRIAVFCIAVEAKDLEKMKYQGVTIFHNAEAFERANPKWLLHFLAVGEQGRSIVKIPILTGIYVHTDGQMVVADGESVSAWKVVDHWPDMYRNIPNIDLEGPGVPAKEHAECAVRFRHHPRSFLNVLAAL